MKYEELEAKAQFKHCRSLAAQMNQLLMDGTHPEWLTKQDKDRICSVPTAALHRPDITRYARSE